MGRFLKATAALAVLAAAFAFAAKGVWPWRRLEVVAPPVIAAEPVERWVASDTLRPGETLGDLFGRHGIGAIDLQSVVRLLGLDPRRVRAGQVFRFGHEEAPSDSGASLVDVTVRTSHDRELRIVRTADDWIAEPREIRWERHPVRLEGRVSTSLYEALAGAAMSSPVDADDRVRLAWSLADVFAWSIDFTRDIQPDDRFVVVFEREVSELGEQRLGRILATELEVGDRHFSAYHFETPDGKSQYFDEDGTSLRRAFLRAPVEFRRISSGFARSRNHPILGIKRRHEGIDYAANSGTPVLAAGNGVVQSAGWAGGYGQMVEIRHQNGITTRYAHLRGFPRGIRAGVRVRQGDVIGFVGATGLATAAHLHYEFRQNGVARDPNRIDLGNGEPVSSEDLPAFLRLRDSLRALLAPAAIASGAIAGDR